MEIHVEKTREQNLVLGKWADANYFGTYIGCTGVGKTLIGVRAAHDTVKQFGESARIIIVVPTENLRDNEWRREFVNWDAEYLLNIVEIVCIQTAYKYEGMVFDCAIIDEVHMTASEEYSNFFIKNKFKRLLALTATIDDERKLEFITKMAPVIHETSIQRALDLGLVSNFTIYNLAVHLSPESRQKYRTLMSKYNEYENLLGGKYAAFGNAARIIKAIKEIPKDERTEEQKLLLQRACVFWATMTKRKTFLYNLPEKIHVAHEIIELFPDRKSIVFAESIKYAEQLRTSLGNRAVIYHSKMSMSARKNSLQLFGSDNGMVRTLCSVRALNVGCNVPEASLGICASGNGKWLDQVQRNGRVIRYADGKSAIYVNLYAYDTQEVKWVFNRTKKLGGQNVKWITKIHEIKP